MDGVADKGLGHTTTVDQTILKAFLNTYGSLIYLFDADFFW